jgi:hypothetical protein
MDAVGPGQSEEGSRPDPARPRRYPLERMRSIQYPLGRLACHPGMPALSEGKPRAWNWTDPRGAKVPLKSPVCGDLAVATEQARASAGRLARVREPGLVEASQCRPGMHTYGGSVHACSAFGAVIR